MSGLRASISSTAKQVARTCFHCDQALMCRGRKFCELSAVELLAKEFGTSLVDGYEVKPILTEINANDVDAVIVHGRSSRVEALSMRWRWGRPFH
ncbi:hypothetical protein WK04_15545 [Burkholderia ubonensis]|nr:hypothetical protein WK04_15545 [Burkholderia ubonensis]